MPRPKKFNKLPQTTVALDIELVEQFQKLKKHGESMNDFLRRLLIDYSDLDDSLKVMRDLYHKKCKELEKVNKIVIPEITIER